MGKAVKVLVKVLRGANNLYHPRPATVAAVRPKKLRYIVVRGHRERTPDLLRSLDPPYARLGDPALVSRLLPITA